MLQYNTWLVEGCQRRDILLVSAMQMIEADQREAEKTGLPSVGLAR